MICAWRTPFGLVEPAQVVIEAFGCALPETYLTAMSEQSPPPVWINLEYLSAEPWVAEHHGLPSPHPRLPLTKYFFFPGYTPDTGGLLVEADFDEQRTAFLKSGVADYWRQLGLDAPQADELRVSLFAYENPALPGLLDAWAADAHAVTCLVPEGRVIPQLAAWLGVLDLQAGDAHQRGALRLHVLPFSDQDAYDHLLWACDLNFVRGEDSCVRAQWAAHPLVWQAYPQAEQAHWDKLNALLAHYTDDLDSSGRTGGPATCGRAGTACRARIWPPAGLNGGRNKARSSRHADAWRDRLRLAGKLTGKLVEFAENKLK